MSDLSLRQQDFLKGRNVEHWWNWCPQRSSRWDLHWKVECRAANISTGAAMEFPVQEFVLLGEWINPSPEGLSMFLHSQQTQRRSNWCWEWLNISGQLWDQKLRQIFICNPAIFKAYGPRLLTLMPQWHLHLLNPNRLGVSAEPSEMCLC